MAHGQLVLHGQEPAAGHQHPSRLASTRATAPVSGARITAK